MKRIFLIVLDSFGIGEMPDAANYGDEGSNTLVFVESTPVFGDVPAVFVTACGASTFAIIAIGDRS